MTLQLSKQSECERLERINAELLAALIELASGHSMAGEAQAREAIARATTRHPEPGE